MHGWYAPARPAGHGVCAGLRGWCCWATSSPSCWLVHAAVGLGGCTAARPLAPLRPGPFNTSQAASRGSATPRHVRLSSGLSVLHSHGRSRQLMAASALAFWPGVQQTASQQLLRHLAAWQLHAGSPSQASACGCGLQRSAQQQQEAAPACSAWPARVWRLQACGCNLQAYHQSCLATAAEPQRSHAWGPGHMPEVTTGRRLT